MDYSPSFVDLIQTILDESYQPLTSTKDLTDRGHGGDEGEEREGGKLDPTKERL